MELLLKGGTIYPITSKPFVGDILIRDGKIVEVAKSISADCETVELEGKFVFPGFVDAHSHIGVFEEGVGEKYYQDGNEMTDPLTPDVRVIDAFNPQDAAIERALSGGVTTAMVVPGSANPVGGLGAIMKFKSMIVDEMIVREPAGLKMATGENPKRVYGKELKRTPGTRLGTAEVIRSYFTKVKNYMAKKAIAEAEGKEFTDYDTKMEAGELVLSKKIPARIHAHRMDDILTAIRISEEFDFRLVIEHATEAYKIADYIKEKNIPIVIGPIFGFRTKLELKDMSYEAPRIINEKGILAGFMCDHPVIPLEFTNVQLATATRFGAKEEDLLKMVTINPAKILEIDDRVGSIEIGKDADIVVWSGHPFDMSSYVEKVYIEGTRVYIR